MKNKNATVPKNPGNAAKLATGNAPSCSGLDSAVAVVTAMPTATDAVPTAEITATPLISRNHDSAIMSGPTSASMLAVVGDAPNALTPSAGTTTFIVSAMKIK